MAESSTPETPLVVGDQGPPQSPPQSNQFLNRKKSMLSLMSITQMMANISQLNTILRGGPERVQFYPLMLSLVVGSLAFQFLFSFLMFLVWLRMREDSRDVEEAQHRGYVSASYSPNDQDGYNPTTEDLSTQFEAGITNKCTLRIDSASFFVVMIIITINLFITGFGIKVDDLPVQPATSVPYPAIPYPDTSVPYPAPATYT